MKTCTKCNKSKPLTEFHNKKLSSDGKASWCKPCAINGAKSNNQKLQKTLSSKNFHYSTELRNITNIIKSKYKCLFCFENDPCCLDFHHINNDKLYDVSRLTINKQRKQLIEEINKCIVICANCHRKLHASKLIIPVNTQTCNENFNDYFYISFNRTYIKEQFKLRRQELNLCRDNPILV